MTAPTPAPVAFDALQLSLETRPSYLTPVPLREDTLARAADVNLIQANVDAAFGAFAQDVNLTLQAMLQATVARINMLERQIRAFEIAMTQRFEEYRAEVDAELASIRELLAQQIAALKTELTTLLKAEDAKVLASSRAYTDSAEKRLHRLMFDSARWGHLYLTPVVGDNNNYRGGWDWKFNPFTIPDGTTLYVSRWGYNFIPTGDMGGATDEVRLSWPPFLPSHYASGGSIYTVAGSQGASRGTPFMAIRGPYSFELSFWINNLKGYTALQLSGYLIPDALEAIALREGWLPPNIGAFSSQGLSSQG